MATNLSLGQCQLLILTLLLKLQFKKNNVVKFATKLVLENQGDRHGVIAKDAHGDVTILVFVWLDRDREYFLSVRAQL